MRPLLLVCVALLAASCGSVGTTTPAGGSTAVPGEFACPDPASSASRGEAAVSAGAVAARLCPRLEVLGYGRDPEPNMLAPLDALTADVGQLVDVVNTQPLVDTIGVQMCPAAGGLNFLLVLQYGDGSLRTLSGSLGGCGQIQLGPTTARDGALHVLEAFDELLEAQRSALSPPGVTVPLTCPVNPEIGYALMTPTARPEEVTRAILCTHDSWKQPYRPAAAVPPAGVEQLVRDVSGPAASSDDPPEELRNCPEPLLTTIVAQTVWGDVFQLDDVCTYLMAGGRVWKQSPDTSATIDGLATAALRP